MNTLRIAAQLAIASLILAGCGGGQSPRDPRDPTGVPRATTFAKSYGDSRNNSATLAIPASEGGYIFVGAWGGWIDVEGQTHAGTDAWVGKIDANGDSEWQLLLGEGFEDEPGEAVSIASQMHRTPDGGYIVGGSIKRPDTGHDFLLRKLNAAGSTEWSRAYDSGAWRDYSYLAGSESALVDDLHSSTTRSAQDRIVDLYPAPGGGYWAVGRSVANVHTERESFDTGHEQSIDDDYSSITGQSFFGAESVVVLRFDEDGQLLGQHRYTDDQFDALYVLSRSRAMIRPAADGTALLVRWITSFDAQTADAAPDRLLIDRVGANGQSLDHLETPTDSVGIAVDIIQTDDPSGADPAVRDGVRDDGYAILGDTGLLKVSRDLTVEWVTDFEYLLYQAIEQLCEPGASGPACHLIVGGVERWDEEGAAVAVIDDAGQILNETRLTTFQSIDAMRVRGDRLQIVGSEQDNPGSGVTVETDTQLTQIEGTLHEFPRIESSSGVARRATTIYGDGGFAYSYGNDGPFVPYSPSGDVEATLSFAPRHHIETARGIVEVARGSYIAVIDVEWDSAESAQGVRKIWLVRITNGQIEWQRALTPENLDAYSASGVAPSGDGGVVLAVRTTSSAPTLAPTSVSPHRLIKIDGSGSVVWETPRLASEGRTDTDRLAVVPDGYVVLGASGVMSRVDASGRILWETALNEPGSGPTEWESIIAVDANADGRADDGFVLLAAGGPDQGSVRILRADPTGVPIWSRGYALLPAVTINPLQILQTTDGGLLIGGDGMETRPGAGQSGPTPGNSNLAFIKLTLQGDLVWSRYYGGLMNEFFASLRPTSDGGVIVAAHSDSMGDRREAWILRLGADGLIAPGCNADLGSFAQRQFDTVSVLAPTATPLTSSLLQPSIVPVLAETHVPPERPDVITARQCLGTANSADPLPSGEQVTLTIVQAGEEEGVVTSVPRGIACGTGAGSQFCSATFPAGTRVALRAGIEHFRSWLSACDEDTGGTSFDCVIVLDSNRTVEVDFGPPTPPTRFTLSFDVEGPGFVDADGISCSEGGHATECSRTLPADAEIDVTARPLEDWRGSGERARFLGWGGDCASAGIVTSLTLTLNRDLHCIARFEPPNIELLTISVTGAGAVRDVPPGRFDCREGLVGGGCESRFPPGDGAVTLHAVPDLGQLFVGWGGDCASFGAAPVIDLFVEVNMTCTARFEQATTPALLTVELTDASGTAIVESSPAGINCSVASGSACSAAFAPGTRVSLRTTRRNVIWSGCDEIFDLSFCRVDIDTTPRSVRASFP